MPTAAAAGELIQIDLAFGRCVLSSSSWSRLVVGSVQVVGCCRNDAMNANRPHPSGHPSTRLMIRQEERERESESCGRQTKPRGDPDGNIKFSCLSKYWLCTAAGCRLLTCRQQQQPLVGHISPAAAGQMKEHPSSFGVGHSFHCNKRLRLCLWR